MSLEELAARLEAARAAVKAIYKNSAKPFPSSQAYVEWQRREEVVREELLAAERDFANAKGEEYAVRLDLGVKWDIGAPCPHLVSNGHAAAILFFESEPHPDWEGTNPIMVDPGSSRVASIAVVEFPSCSWMRFGGPNDEVMEGYPLYGKGLEPYEAHHVMNSRWIRELEEINKVHPLHDPDPWKRLHHYLFMFHDQTFECIAPNHCVERHRDSLPSVLRMLTERILGA